MKSTNEPNDSGPNAFPFYCAIAVGVAVIFAILYWPSIRGYYRTAQAAKVLIMPPGDGGSGTLEFKPVSRDDERGVVVANTVYEVPVDTPPKLGPNDVVVTDSMRRLTMFAEMPTPNVLYDNRGFRAHVITQAEAEEVVKLLSDHAENLESFLEQLRQERRTDDAARISADTSLAKATLAKWRKRVEEGKK